MLLPAVPCCQPDNITAPIVLIIRPIKCTACTIWPTAPDDTQHAGSVCLSATWLCCAKTTKRIEVLFVVEILGDRRHSVLDEGLDPPTATWRQSGKNCATVKYRNIACI